MADDTQTLTVPLPADVHQRLIDLAAEQDRTPEEQIVHMLKEHLPPTWSELYEEVKRSLEREAIHSAAWADMLAAPSTP